MMGAHQLRQHRNPQPFEPAEGTVTVEVDPETGDLCTAACPERQTEVFIAGSQPTRLARSGGQDVLLATSVAGWDTAAPVASDNAVQAHATPDTRGGLVGKPRVIEIPGVNQPANGKAQPQEPEKKKGFFSRILDVFK
jgi:hypothetical protein